MPKTCEECSFGYEEDVAWMACIPQGVSMRKESVSGICDPHCPLVEVPAPHGRIADMDEAIKCIEEVKGKDAEFAISLIEWACGKRTVIEAEGTE